LYKLFQEYSEDPDMPDKLKEFVRETIDELLDSLPAEERLKGLAAEERLKGLAAEERLKGLSAEEVVKGLSPETLEALTRQLKANGSGAKPH
jgi:predicted Zn-dependent peptidase